MKNTWLPLLLLAGTSHGAITISGAAVTAARDSTGTTAAAGCLALLIVDTTGNGFFGMGNISPNTTLTAANDPAINGQIGYTIGSTFGGDLILNTMTTSPSGTISDLLTNVSVADYLGKNFAVVWFDGSQPYIDIQHWGAVRGLDWTFPAADSDTFTMSATDVDGGATYYRVNANAPIANSYNFRTGFAGGNGGAVILIMPEPSVALLSGLGALGLLRRRRS